VVEKKTELLEQTQNMDPKKRWKGIFEEITQLGVDLTGEMRYVKAVIELHSTTKGMVGNFQQGVFCSLEPILLYYNDISVEYALSETLSHDKVLVETPQITAPESRDAAVDENINVGSFRICAN